MADRQEAVESKIVANQREMADRSKTGTCLFDGNREEAVAELERLEAEVDFTTGRMK